jgi:hypothetical protein
MNTSGKCESCGMPIESGVYCQHCTDATGKLQEFDERLKRMAQWTLRQGQAKTPAEAEQRALAYMATMPTWRDHPKLAARMKRKA